MDIDKLELQLKKFENELSKISAQNRTILQRLDRLERAVFPASSGTVQPPPPLPNQQSVHSPSLTATATQNNHVTTGRREKTSPRTAPHSNQNQNIGIASNNTNANSSNNNTTTNNSSSTNVSALQFQRISPIPAVPLAGAAAEAVRQRPVTTRNRAAGGGATGNNRLSSYQLESTERSRTIKRLEDTYGGHLLVQRSARIIQHTWRHYKMSKNYFHIKERRSVRHNRTKNSVPPTTALHREMPLSLHHHQPPPKTSLSSGSKLPLHQEEVVEEEAEEAIETTQLDSNKTSPPPIGSRFKRKSQQNVGASNQRDSQQKSMAVCVAASTGQIDAASSFHAGITRVPPSSSTTSNSIIGGSEKVAHLRKIAINIFNRDPVKGVQFLLNYALLEDSSANGLADFLFSERGLSKEQVGNYLGRIDDATVQQVAGLYIRRMQFAGLEVDQALRQMLSCFRLNGESQKVEFLMELFGKIYVEQNSSEWIAARFRNARDSVVVLAYAVVMLHTDAHNCSISAKRKMTCEQFVRNLRGIDKNVDLPQEMLHGIYSRIRAHQFQLQPDHSAAVRKVYGWLTANSLKPNDLIKPHRKLVQTVATGWTEYSGSLPSSSVVAVSSASASADHSSSNQNASQNGGSAGSGAAGGNTYNSFSSKDARILLVFNDLILIVKQKRKKGSANAASFAAANAANQNGEGGAVGGGGSGRGGGLMQLSASTSALAGGVPADGGGDAIASSSSFASATSATNSNSGGGNTNRFGGSAAELYGSGSRTFYDCRAAIPLLHMTWKHLAAAHSSHLLQLSWDPNLLQYQQQSGGGSSGGGGGGSKKQQQQRQQRNQIVMSADSRKDLDELIRVMHETQTELQEVLGRLEEEFPTVPPPSLLDANRSSSQQESGGRSAPLELLPDRSLPQSSSTRSHQPTSSSSAAARNATAANSRNTSEKNKKRAANNQSSLSDSEV